MFGHHHNHHRHERFAHRPFGFGGGRHRHFGGRGRVFEQGDLRYVILQLIADKPSHGYEIIKAIEEKLAGAYAPSPGVVYPTLTLLEELGFVTVEADGGKKLYTLTPEGAAALAENRATVDAIFSRMRDLGERHGARMAPQIVRAGENLKTALRLRLSQGPLSDEQVAAVAQALDVAAKAVEGA